MWEQSVSLRSGIKILVKQNGMDVCIPTTANTDNEVQRLLALLGTPFREGSGGGPTVSIRKRKKKAHHFESEPRGRWSSIFFTVSFSSLSAVISTVLSPVPLFR